MALTTSSQAPQASATNTAGSTTTGSAFSINYGVSGVAKITNGGTGPTIGCDFVVELSNDGGTTWFEWSRQTAGVAASTTYPFDFGFGIGGNGGDMGKYRTKFTGNTGQSVTVQADASTTTAII
jgi:hypothetical protein